MPGACLGKQKPNSVVASRAGLSAISRRPDDVSRKTDVPPACCLLACSHERRALIVGVRGVEPALKIDSTKGLAKGWSRDGKKRGDSICGAKCSRAKMCGVVLWSAPSVD